MELSVSTAPVIVEAVEFWEGCLASLRLGPSGNKMEDQAAFSMTVRIQLDDQGNWTTAWFMEQRAMIVGSCPLVCFAYSL